MICLTNSSELCYYDYIIKIFLQKNHCALTRCFRENIYINVIVTIMEGEEQIFHVKWSVLASWLVRFYQRETEIKNWLLLFNMKLRNMNRCKYILITGERRHSDTSAQAGTVTFPNTLSGSFWRYQWFRDGISKGGEQTCQCRAFTFCRGPKASAARGEEMAKCNRIF